LHYPDHPHARGFKDYDRLVCRFCKTRFKITIKEKKGRDKTQ